MLAAWTVVAEVRAEVRALAKAAMIRAQRWLARAAERSSSGVRCAGVPSTLKVTYYPPTFQSYSPCRPLRPLRPLRQKALTAARTLRLAVSSNTRITIRIHEDRLFSE